MAQGWSGNVAAFGFGKQSAKGTGATVPAWKTKYIGGDIAPVRAIARLEETAASRDVGAAYLDSVVVRGNPAFYLRPDDFASAAYYALGTNVDSGAGPFIHTITPINTDLPYVTFWNMVAGSTGAGARIEKFVDAKVDSLKISGGSGKPFSAELGIVGLGAAFLATDDAVVPVATNPYTWDQLTITKGGSSILTCTQLDLEIVNGVVPMIGNGSIVPYDLFPGERQVSGSMTILYEDVTKDYKQFQYASAAGGAVAAPARTLYQQQLIFTLTSGTNTVVITVNNVTYTEVPVMADASGAPIMSAMAFTAEPNPGGSIVTIVVTNSTATVG